MTQKQSETISCFMDGIRVKISEKYKPPPKITLAMTYAQRLTLNRQLQENMPSYNFDMNSCVKEKMKEWQAARSNINAQRKIKLERIGLEEKLKEKEILQAIAAKAESNKTSGMKENDHSGLLIPTQSNILTPIQLVPLAPQKYVQTLDDASPINISDFEPDTSSPFDNLELKSINDLEELKLVLQNDDKSKYQVKHEKRSNYALPNNQSSGGVEPSHISYYNLSMPMQYETNNTQYSTAATSTTDTNGYAPYYGNSSDLYAFYKQSTDFNSTVNNFALNVNAENESCPDTEYTQYNMVPDIIKALQNQLNLNIQHEHSVHTAGNVIADSEAAHSHSKSKLNPVDNQLPVHHDDEKLENPYHSLCKSAQNICDTIASMGFPIARVARVCKSIGDDEKKVVEFLLCQSQLMDLGFSEEKVSSALNESDNNRDKALELLIS